MGCVVSKRTYTAEDESKAGAVVTPAKVEWKLLLSADEAREKFEKDGTLSKNSDPGHLELRAMLDETLAQHTLGKFAKEIKALDIFMCWVDVQEYKSIPTEDYRRSKAMHIFHKYIKSGAVLQVGGIDLNLREEFQADIEKSKTNKELLTTTFFDRIQSSCFLEIYHNVFIPFKLREEYHTLTIKLKQKYNNVKTDDFDYYKKLGEGGFGLVVHCRKKTTGKHCAMKIQTKKGLLECFSDDPWRADFEKQAFASCQHPFIVNLDYSFQNEALAIMVLGLGTGGDLQKALSKAPDEKLGEDRVRFYVAEIVLALGHLHAMGLMYRDLKPSNILLNADGHIQLVDLGGVVDEKGKTLGLHDENQGLAPLFAQKFARPTILDEIPEEAEPTDKKPMKRRMSIMGTFGYMAPEMVIILSQTSVERTGYTNAVDWWSLGVTTFKLLSGQRPFTEENFSAFMEMATTIHGKINFRDATPEYAILFQEIPFPSNMSPEATDLISRLLDVNDKTRLGSGPHGVADIKAHRFFKNIDWERLEQKQMTPPFFPEPVFNDADIPVYATCEEMLKEMGKETWMTDLPRQRDQKYFVNWDFTSPHTQRIEFGIANEMEQYDRNYKARALMGGKDNQNSVSGRDIKNNSKRA